MNKTFLMAILLCISLLFTSCSSKSTPQQTTTQILSNPSFDGTVTKYPLASAMTITQGMTPAVQSVFAGIDPAIGAEYRAFLDFPLTGAGGVPGYVSIASAYLDIVINAITPYPLTGSIPIRIDLISMQSPILVVTDFDRTIQPALASTTITPPISQSDFGQHIVVDVTSLMVEAQRLGLADFQIRILEDLGPVAPGFIEINDTTGTNQGALAPLLEVTYN